MTEFVPEVMTIPAAGELVRENAVAFDAWLVLPIMRAVYPVRLTAVTVMLSE